MRKLSLFLVLATCVLAQLISPKIAEAQELGCHNAQFSEAVLHKFPSIRDACLDVVQHQGGNFAVFKADLLRVKSSGVEIRPKLPDGSHAEARFVRVAPERRVLVDGHKYRFDELALGQELTVYIQVKEPMVALAPPGEAAEWELAPLEDIEPTQFASSSEAPAMPHTASVVPYFGVGGSALLCAGLVIAVLRRRLPRARI